MSSIIEKEKGIESDPNQIDTVLELQLGDVIQISSPTNEVLNDQTFIIDYIDKSKTYLINTDTLDKLRLSISEQGVMGDGNITRIAILSRSDSASYAEQNGFLPGKWINIYFGGEIPIIITGEITNLENDMIEIKSVDGDVIYINFDYKGIPENLPIEMIEIREKPSQTLGMQQSLDELPELPNDSEKEVIEPEKIQINIQVKDIKDQLREFIVKADNVKFGNEEFGKIVQYVDVSSKNQRYSIETQVSDLLDELLSTIPNAERTPRVLNNIHIMIERFKQLRERFSFFDQYGNVDGISVKEAAYKPLTVYFKQLQTNLYWILPVVKNIKKVYDVEHIDDENTDIVNLDLTGDLKSIQELVNNYKANDIPSDQNRYAELYTDINSFLTPYDLIRDEELGGIIDEKYVQTNVNTIIDNLEEMYSSIYSSNAVRTRRFVIQKYNTALSKLDTIDSTSSKLHTIRTDITKNDIMSIKSFITLPEPVIRFSKVNLPGTSILEKANLNLSFLNYWQLLKKNTNVNTTFIDNFETGIEFNEQNFANNIRNFTLNLSEQATGSMTRKEIYDNFVKTIVPRTKILFNLMKKYITGKLSIIDVVSYLEPFLVYTDDLTYMQYKEIIEFIDEKISQYNKKFIERSRIFKMIYQTRLNNKSIIPSRAFSILDVLKKMRNEIIVDGYDMDNPEKTFTNSEILRKITLKDNTRLYTTAISVQNFPLIFPSEFANLFEEEKNKLDDKLKKEAGEDKCKTVIIAKYYNSVDELNNDNDKTNIYFDKKYDKTNYGIIEDVYGKEVMIMSSEELTAYITKDLMKKKKMSEYDAEYMATTLVDGHKKVIEGQFAILYKGYQENVADEVDFYVRKNNKWELDTDVSKQDINSDESSALCNLQEKCITVQGPIDDKCESMKENELSLQTKLLKDVISEFDGKYKMSKQDLQTKVTDKLEYLTNIIHVITKIETNEMFKYNNQKYKIGATIDDKQIGQVSPYQDILNIILKESDFVKKQHYIIKFTTAFTRPFIPGMGPLNEKESQHWLYCLKTNIPILPTFKYELAEVFIVGGEYEYINKLEFIKSEIGAESDDGDWWVDKHSGWPICPIDFSVEEGYEEGFRISSRAVMETDAGNKIQSALSDNSIKYTTPDTIMINNIINTISIAMGINITTQKEFIMNSVLSSIRETVESEEDYKQKVREMAEKGKKMMAYKDFYNTAILYYTLGMFLIAIQTSVPSVKTRKTHPGCVRSFTGYPFEGAGDLSSLTYIGCVAYDIRESGEPWNVLKGKKQEVIINKIKGSIDDVLLAIPDVKRKFEDKTEYLLTSPANEIPEEHDISKWHQFLPPLVNFKIKHLLNISPEFKKGLLSDLRSGASSQRDKICVIESKIIQFSLALIERIQEVVKKQKLLLHTSGNEPYLENACCEGSEIQSTISYFTDKDPRIIEYNDIVNQLTNIMEDIISYSTSGLFYSNKNTKNKYPSISDEFSEKTIYLAFIHFCKFKTLIPIPEDLLPFCTDKPDHAIINPNDSVEQMIQKLKDDGRNYSNEHFLRMLQIISQHNRINISVEPSETSAITRLTKLLESIDDENDEVVEKSLRELINKSLDSFEIATENYTREVKDLNNFLIKNIDSMKKEIVDFVQKNTGSGITQSSVRKMTNTITNLASWSSDASNRNEDNKISDDKLYNITNFYKNFINSFVNIFPNIILNKVNYDETHIPNYHGFSKNHTNKLKKYIGQYYEKLKTFYDISTLENVLITIQKTSKNLVMLADYTPSFTSIRISKDKIIKPILDERTSRFLFEYYLIRVLLNYIELTDEDDMIVTETRKNTNISDVFTTEYLEDVETRIDLSITTRNKTDIRLLTGNKKELRQKTAELLISFIDIMNNEKHTIDTSYEDIQDRVFKLREREKDLVTDRLQKMTDEARDADTILKINKLGMYSKGMQKGLTTLDKDFYDEEQDFRDTMTRAEREIRKKNVDANDENIDILLDEYIEQRHVDDEIDAEAYDMEFMNETYYDGNTDGVGAPEEEYNDYQEDM
jgi:hypothetical protein